MKHFIVAFLMVSAVDYSIMDSDGDRTKSIIFINYNDGTEDRLVVNKVDLDTPAMYKAIKQVEDKRIK